MRLTISMLDLDASGCFDRMVGLLLSIINQTRGSTPEAAACQAEVVHKMRHTASLPTATIWHVNACHLYLRVTMVSDIATDHSSIDRCTFQGLRPSTSFLNYPYQPRPPPE